MKSFNVQSYLLLKITTGHIARVYRHCFSNCYVGCNCIVRIWEFIGLVDIPRVQKLRKIVVSVVFVGRVVSVVFLVLRSSHIQRSSSSSSMLVMNDIGNDAYDA